MAFRRAVLAAVAALSLAPSSFAAELSDPVPGHPDLTYEDIVKLVTPDVAKGEDDRYAGTLPDEIRGFAPAITPAAHAGKGEFEPPDAIAVTAGGKDRVLLLINFALRTEYNDTFAALSLIGFEGGPKLLDIVNVSMGMNVFFQEPKVLPVGPGESAVLVQSQMQSGSRIFNSFALALLRDDRIERIADLWTWDDMNCAGMHSVNLAFRAQPGEKRFGDITVAMTEEQDGGATAEDCGADPIPEPFTTEATVTYRWDEAQSKYLPDSAAFDRFAR